MKLIRSFSELTRPTDIMLGSELFRLEEALRRKQLETAKNIIQVLPLRVKEDHVEWLLACFQEFISLMIDQRDCEQTKRYVDKFSETVMKYSINKEEKAAFYVNLANTFFAHSVPHSSYVGSEYAAHYVHASFLYHPLELSDDPRVTLLDTIQKSFLLSVTEGKGLSLEYFESKWKLFRDELYALRRKTRERLSSVEERQSSDIAKIRHEFNSGIRLLMARIAEEMLRRLRSPANTLLCDMTLLGAGSIAISYFTAFSDFDVALLVDKERYRNSENFRRFIRLLSFELICMGEEQCENLQNRKIAGSCIDPFNRLSLLSHDEDEGGCSPLIHGPEAMGEKWFFKRDSRTDIISNEANELLRTVALYSSSEGINLFARYQYSLSVQRKYFNEEEYLRALDRHMETSKNKLIEFRRKLSMKAEELIDMLELKFDVKEVLIRPLLLWISDVAFIFGNTEVTLDGFFKTLSDVGFFDYAFIERLRFGLEYLWKLKFELEYDGKFISTGRDFSIDYDELSFDKQQLISELIETLIFPLTASAKTIIDRILIYRTYTPASLNQRMSWYQKIKNDIIIPTENNTQQILLRTFCLDAMTNINPLVIHPIEICTYALSRAVTDSLIIRESDDLIRFDYDNLLTQQSPFLTLTTREGKIAYWLACLPTPGYHDVLFELFANVYTHAIGQHQIVMLRLADFELPCLLIERRQTHLFPIPSLSSEVFTSLLLRALLLDSEERSKQAQLLYCLEQMRQPEALDPLVIKRFIHLENLLITDWHAQLERMNHAYIALGVPLELISTQQQDFHDLACKMDERYQRLRKKLSQQGPMRGIDLLASVDPVFVYYYQHSFNETPMMEAQERYCAISKEIRLEKKQYIRKGSHLLPRITVESTENLRQRLIHLDRNIRHAARDELQGLSDLEKYDVMTDFFQEDLLSTEPNKRKKQISYIAKAFAIIFPIVSEPLNYMTDEEVISFNQQVSDFRTTSVLTELSPMQGSPIREKKDTYREELSQLEKMMLEGRFVLDEQAYGQTIVHLAAKYGKDVMGVLRKLHDAGKLDMACQRNHAGWTFLSYIVNKRDSSWQGNLI